MEVAIIPGLRLTKNNKYIVREVAQYLNEISKDVDKVIFVGPIFDLSNVLLPTNKARKREIDIIKFRQKEIISIISGIKFHCVISRQESDIFNELGLIFKERISYQIKIDSLTIGQGKKWRLKSPTVFIQWLTNKLYRFPLTKQIIRRINDYILGFINLPLVIAKSKKLLNSPETKAIVIGTGLINKERVTLLVGLQPKTIYCPKYTNIPEISVLVCDTVTGNITKSHISQRERRNIRKTYKEINISGRIISTLDVSSITSLSIKIGSKGRVSHTMMAEGMGRLLESVSKHGTSSTPIEEYLDGKHIIIVQELIDTSRNKEILSDIKKEIGIKYAFKQIVLDIIYICIERITFGLVSPRRLIHIDVNPKAAKCSELIAKAVQHRLKIQIAKDVAPCNTYPEDFLKNNIDLKVVYKYYPK